MIKKFTKIIKKINTKIKSKSMKNLQKTSLKNRNLRKFRHFFWQNFLRKKKQIIIQYK